MEITVKILPPADGRRQEVRLVLPEKATIQEAVEALAKIFGEKRQLLVNEKGQLLPAWRVFLNEKLLDNNEGTYQTTVLSQGDNLVLLLALAGG